ncbi:hypothetical protein [Carboxylicivirga marina]|uniref:Uncharacterized protein n=1 Tax=Carboxylicivirga marina TaxID=2800988 RepID=A0ABS1HKU3_9BACT|nr:hypothetical protein [Carboxylicivirga marina]MBK3518085.1 hypothetical protein [Carboxylicivirga marina]
MKRTKKGKAIAAHANALSGRFSFTIAVKETIPLMIFVNFKAKILQNRNYSRTIVFF